MTRDCCSECGCAGDDKIEGIAEGLRMAGEIAIASGIYDNGIRTRDDIWKAILAKAKEVEELKGEK